MVCLLIALILSCIPLETRQNNNNYLSLGHIGEGGGLWGISPHPPLKKGSNGGKMLMGRIILW